MSLKWILILILGAALIGTAFFFLGGEGGLGSIVVAIGLLLKKLFGGGEKTDLDKESEKDRDETKRRKDDLRKNTSAADFANKLSHGSNRARRKRK